MRYTCKLCSYTTDNRNQIHKHHILPKEQNGSNNKYNIVIVCPNCHCLIYSKYATKGIHSIKNDNSIEIIGYRNNGKYLEVIKNNETKYLE